MSSSLSQLHCRYSSYAPGENTLVIDDSIPKDHLARRLDIDWGRVTEFLEKTGIDHNHPGLGKMAIIMYSPQHEISDAQLGETLAASERPAGTLHGQAYVRDDRHYYPMISLNVDAHVTSEVSKEEAIVRLNHTLRHELRHVSQSIDIQRNVPYRSRLHRGAVKVAGSSLIGLAVGTAYTAVERVGTFAPLEQYVPTVALAALAATAIVVGLPTAYSLTKKENRSELELRTAKFMHRHTRLEQDANAKADQYPLEILRQTAN